MNNILPDEANHYKVGSVVANRYRVEEVLGCGAVGLVVKVHDSFLNDQVCALKILLKRAQQDPTTMARFRREVILARTLGHTNIIRIYDIGQTEHHDPFVAMECIEGMTLHKVIAVGKLEWERGLGYLRGIAQGLAYAHSHGIYHRDLKPSNVMITSDDVPKIADFGTAIGTLNDEKLTRPDELVGSPLYISPEAITKGVMDARSDIYAFGALAFTVFEEAPPFFHPNWAALAHMHITAEIPAFEKAECPAWCYDMIVRCMQKDPDDRFQSFDEISRLIDARTGQQLGAKCQSSLQGRLIDLAKVASGALIGGVIGARFF